jgi:SAM-dependent methyltransferase
MTTDVQRDTRADEAAGVNAEALRHAVRDEYTAVATQPARGFHFHTGRPLAGLLGYSDELLAGIPDDAIASMAGTGNPFALGPLAEGERVVDAGSGAGVDSLVAARLVGPGGAVIGVDMTSAMIAKARRAAASAGLGNVEFRVGYLEALPVDSGWADVVISNGVLNLVPDKATALAELSRVLRPGGRLQLADIVLGRPVSAESKVDVSLWTGCIAGGLLENQLVALLEAAGFEEVQLIRGTDVFAGAPQHSNAAAFGTIGVGIRARKPVDAGALADRELGRRFVEALVRGDFDTMRALLHPDIEFRGLSPHKFLKASRRDPVGGVIRAFRLWFFEGADVAFEGDHPEELLSCSVDPYGSGGRYKLSYRVREKSREMAEAFRTDGLGSIDDDADWIVEQEAYYDVRDGRIGWMIVLCGGYQPMIPVPTARQRETPDRQFVL